MSNLKIALAAGLLFASSSCRSGLRHMGEDLNGVQALLDRQETAWNAGDIEGFMAEGYWQSGRLTFLSGDDWIWGYDNVLQRYNQRYLSDGKEMGTLEFTDEQIVPLGPDSALVRGRYQLEFSDGETDRGLFSLVMRRTDEGWRIVHDHTSSAH